MSLRDDPSLKAAIEKYRAQDAAFAALPMTDLPAESANSFIEKWAAPYNRVKMMLTLRPRMDYADWLVVLGRQWTRATDHHHQLGVLRDALGIAGPLLPMMTPAEHDAYAALPSRVTLFRAAPYQDRKEGIRWSMDEGVARRFPLYGGPSSREPVLITATARKESIVALFLGGEAPEVIAFTVRRSSIVPLQN